MTLKFSPALRDARLDVIASEIGASPVLQIRSGAAPTNLSDAASGTLLATLVLPSTWMNAASGGVATKAGTWQVAEADVSGTAGHFRILEATGTTAFIHGACTDTAGAGPMKLSSTSIVDGEPVTVATFTLTEGNADG